MALVSILIPFFNNEDVIERCIKSVLNQTLTSFQLILINDGSSDKSYQIAYDFSKKDSRILLLTQKNQGQSVARNYGYSFAKGDFIAFLDSDDYWVNTKLSDQIDFISKNNVDGCFVNYTAIHPSNIEKNPPSIENGHIVTFVEIATRNHIIGSCSSLIIKKKILNESTLFEPKRYFEDYDLWFQLINNGAQLIFLNKYLVFIDYSQTSSMNNTDKMFIDYFFMFKKHLPIIYKKTSNNKQLIKILNIRLNHSLIYAEVIKYKLYFYIAKLCILIHLYFKKGVLLWKPSQKKN